MIELDLFSKLVEKYKFTDYIPVEIQKFVVNTKKHVLVSSLKSVGEMNLFYRFVISVYYNARFFGFKPSIVISKVIALAAALIISSLLITSIVFAVNKSASQLLFNNTSTSNSIIGNNIPDNLKSDKNDKEKKDKRVNINNKSTKSETIVKTRLGIDNIISSGVDENNALEITKILFENLQSLKGKNRVIYSSKNRNEKNINRHLLGRLSKVGNTYVMALSIVDTQSGNVLYNKTSTYNDPENANRIIKEIAKEINNNSSVWE
jgi:ABC-type transport system involved in multi-copper enzyme maturation permease subunit